MQFGIYEVNRIRNRMTICVANKNDDTIKLNESTIDRRDSDSNTRRSSSFVSVSINYYCNLCISGTHSLTSMPNLICGKLPITRLNNIVSSARNTSQVIIMCRMQANILNCIRVNKFKRKQPASDRAALYLDENNICCKQTM